jgi:hypothetical protein
MSRSDKQRSRRPRPNVRHGNAFAAVIQRESQDDILTAGLGHRMECNRILVGQPQAEGSYGGNLETALQARGCSTPQTGHVHVGSPIRRPRF